MNIFKKLSLDLSSIILKKFDIVCKDPSIQISHLDRRLATNIAMRIHKDAGLSIKETACIISKSMLSIPEIESVSLAHPGFINFCCYNHVWHDQLYMIINENSKYFIPNIGNSAKINVEYVSANPTGPLHVGHARCAVYGDVLSNLLVACGYNVTKEFYVNDYGSQIDNLSTSVFVHYKNIVYQQSNLVPCGLYSGKYLTTVAKLLYKKYGCSLVDVKDNINTIKVFAVSHMISDIKDDLQELDIRHDVFTLESYLHDSGQVDAIINSLGDYLYFGSIADPKKYSMKCKNKKQLLFKSASLGDDHDRPVRKSDNSWCYFASDLAYMKNKIDREFCRMIVILGYDHLGYVKRLHAGLEAILRSHNIILSTSLCVVLCQLVKYLEGGVSMTMSKRLGNFISLKDVINYVGSDALRFMMLSCKNDMILNFDLKKVQEKSQDNPIFYINYAYARASSVLRNFKKLLPESFNFKSNMQFNLLKDDREIDLIMHFAVFPKMLEGVVKSCELHRIVSYLYNLAKKYHALWNLNEKGSPYRFLVESNIDLSCARMGLVVGIINIINLSFDIIGITPIEEM